MPNEYSEPLVNAYATLYELAKSAGDYKAASSYHEQYAIADKGYLDDVSARHLAYQKITHENLANKLQVDALNRENRVLQLQRQLTAKAVETSRLYIALLGLGVVFLGLLGLPHQALAAAFHDAVPARRTHGHLQPPAFH